MKTHDTYFDFPFFTRTSDFFLFEFVLSENIFKHLFKSQEDFVRGFSWLGPLKMPLFTDKFDNVHQKSLNLQCVKCAVLLLVTFSTVSVYETIYP